MGFWSNLKRTVKQTVKAVANPKALATIALVVATGGVASAMYAGASFSAALSSVATASFWQAAAFRTAIGLGLSAVAASLGPTPDNSGGRSIQDLGAQGAKFQFRSPTAVREVVYGQTRKSGVILHMDSSSSTGSATGTQFLHMIVGISGAKTDSAYKVYLNDVAVSTDLTASDGFIAADSGTTPDYSSKVSLQWKDGSYPQTSLTENSGLNTNPPGWTSSQRLDGISYLYVRMQYDATLFEQGLPNVSVLVKGKPVYDPRTSTTAYSNNPALCIRDYLLDIDYGLGCALDEIDEDSFEIAADVCDENSNQYQLDGVIDTSKSPKTIISDMLTACSGVLSYSNGKFHLRAAKYVAPSVTITEDDLIGEVAMQATNSMRDQFNTVKAIYYSLALNQVTDMPVQENTDLLYIDNGQKSSVDLSLPFTTSETRATKLAELSLFRSRNQMTVSVPVKLNKFNCQIGDNVSLTYPRLGFNSKVFEVVSWSFRYSGDDLGINLTLKENGPDSYTGGTALSLDISRIKKGELVAWDVSDTFGTDYTAATDKVLIIEKGVNIYGRPASSGVSASEALIIPISLGGTLTIRNYGNIYGASGIFDDNYASRHGGDAIYIASSVASQVTIINDGLIAGGGGGGGKGGNAGPGEIYSDGTLPGYTGYSGIHDFGYVLGGDGGDGAGWDGTQLILPGSPLNAGEDGGGPTVLTSSDYTYMGAHWETGINGTWTAPGQELRAGQAGAGGNGGGFAESGEDGEDGELSEIHLHSGMSTDPDRWFAPHDTNSFQPFRIASALATYYQAGDGGAAITNGTNAEIINRQTIHGSIT